MNPWLFPWYWPLKSPLSGDVTQDISPTTSWLSPKFEFDFSGNRQIEAEVVANVASYGKQLGILSEALLEIADDDQGEAVERLRQLTADVREIKDRHVNRPEERLRGELDKLEPKARKALLRKLLDECP